MPDAGSLPLNLGHGEPSKVSFELWSATRVKEQELHTPPARRVLWQDLRTPHLPRPFPASSGPGPLVPAQYLSPLGRVQGAGSPPPSAAHHLGSSLSASEHLFLGSV